MTNPPNPAAVFPLGHYLAEELAARGWTPEELAKRMDVSVHLLRQVLAGERVIGQLGAVLLGKALDTSAEYWLNLERKWREHKRNPMMKLSQWCHEAQRNRPYPQET